MKVRHTKPFTFTPENLKKAEAFLKKYPKGREQSALLPLLDLAQTQNGGWLSESAIASIAEFLHLAPMRVLEVASFYSLFHLKPRGKYHIQVCSTPPCSLCGSDKLLRACKKWLGIDIGETTADGQFCLSETECLGACANASVVAINGRTYEDVTEERMVSILEGLVEDSMPPFGSQTGRKSAAPVKERV
jgi:NADH dehydrogenase (ubiquinone) flavoprotein 2